MIIKNIFSLAASITSLFIIILFSNIGSKADENNIKYYSKDEGILSIMYHRFNESKYPSTNIQMDIFKKHIQIIKSSGFNFHNPNRFKEQFSFSQNACRTSRCRTCICGKSTDPCWWARKGKI